MSGARLSEHLQDLVLENASLDEFLQEMSGAIAEFGASAAGCRVLSSVRLIRASKPAVTAGSDPAALALEQLQDRTAGPALDALETGRTALLDGRLTGDPTEPRLDRYRRTAARWGIRSALSVPVALDDGAAAALTYLAADPHAFDGGAAASCEAFAATAGKSMRLAVRLGSVQDLNRDLLQAMKSRTIINLASGILMAQSRCSQAEAFTLLSKVSNNRNVKVRLVAEEILRRFEPGPVAADFGPGT
ncbi:GAF and ANTAR domain-containing protein [Arthrobacter sp. NicSoilB8]|uniref:GAF and ANTAR domain-containing protein n=1 Tax=Arthrobacter sp. NicSoilB8 TaxID=2830998 RepID=UPI001CC76188|nr:GAF and ANTAR domain-containing protein [Arthrobacter sp. NicSoilB8]BCW69323.1 ANTAR domain-containing protein [Arthrobacter sp. NicSoilB8]